MAVISDPIADMLTRIRNANTANHQTVDIPASRILLPAGEPTPAYALPIIGGGHTYAIVLYGEHRTGEPMDIAASSQPKFRPGKVLKDAVQ